MQDLDPRIASAPPGDTVSDTDSPGMRPSGARIERALPSRVGRFVIVDVVGEGGMGTVYRAYDPDLDRRVAVKVLRQRDEDERATARLVREARTMAQLNHPNVMTVHDVGVHERRVFVAMEYIDGGTLAEWCDARGPDDRGRCDALIDLLRQATSGLAAAHAAAVVHRDVKPANMLIDRNGRLRVADFGLAGSFPRMASSASDDADASSRITDSVTPRPIGLTATAGVRGTPAYMAPEQFHGHADARSDQFGLCSSFYEAFFATKPFGGSGSEQRLARIALARIERPAPGYAAPGWIREMLVRGLHDDPAQRWVSLDQMLEAIDGGAKRPGRRWLGLGLVGGVAIASGSAALFARASDPCVDGPSTFARVWDEARRGAVRDAFFALEVPFARSAVSAVVVDLDDYSTRWVDGWRDACEATRVHHTQSDELMARRMRCLDDGKRQFESLVEVLVAADGTVASNAFRSVAELPRVSNCADSEFVQAQMPMPDDPDVAAEVDALQTDLERIEAMISAGQYEDALATATATADRAARVEHSPIRARAAIRLARARLASGRVHESLEAALSAFELVEDTDATGAADVSTALGVTYQELGRFGDALAHYRRARAIHVRVLEEDDIAIGMMDGRIARVLGYLGSYDEALAGHQRAVATTEAALGKRHPLVAVALTGMGRTLHDRGDFEEADVREREALAMLEDALGPTHPELAWTLDELGIIARARGKYDDALAYLERSRAIRVATLGADHRSIYRSDATLGSVYIDLGRVEEAIAAYQHALELLARAKAPDDLLVAGVRTGLGLAYRRHDENDKALVEYRAALAVYERYFVDGHAETATLHTNIGAVLENQGRYDEALPHLQRALAIRVEKFGEEHPHLADTHATIGYVFAALGRTDDALFHHGRALALDVRAFGRDHPHVAADHNALGFALGPAGEFDRALTEHREALAIYERVVGRDNPNAMWAHLGIGYALADRGDLSEASAAFAAATAISIATKGDTSRDTALPVTGTALCAAALGQARTATEARAHLQRIADASASPVPAALARLATAMARPRTSASETLARDARAELERHGERGFSPVIDRWLAAR